MERGPFIFVDDIYIGRSSTLDVTEETVTVFNVGDVVLVKTWEEIQEMGEPVDHDILLPSGVYFSRGMRKYCGNMYMISDVGVPFGRERYTLDGLDGWIFTSEMITKCHDTIVEDEDISLDFTKLF